MARKLVEKNSGNSNIKDAVKKGWMHQPPRNLVSLSREVDDVPSLFVGARALSSSFSCSRLLPSNLSFFRPSREISSKFGIDAVVPKFLISF